MRRLGSTFQEGCFYTVCLEQERRCLPKHLQMNVEFLSFMPVEATLLSFMLETEQERLDSYLKMQENMRNASYSLMKLIVLGSKDMQQD